jgi:hypothetical protein
LIPSRNFSYLRQKINVFKKMKKLLILTILSMGGLFISCSSDGSDDNTSQTSVTPVILQPAAITISSISSEFVFTGDLLEIVGTDFINKDYPTKIFINDVEISPKELANTKIQILITDALKAGTNTLKLQIDKISSKPISFFVIAKGWNKLEAFGGKDIITSCVFDESRSIFSFIDTDISDNGFWGAPQKLEGKSTGYTQNYINQSGSYGAFKMIDDKIGVMTNSSNGFYTNNCFETQNSVKTTGNFSPEINGLRIGYLDSKSSILTTLLSSQIYTADNGLTVIKNDPPKWSQIIRNDGLTTRLVVYTFGKSTSNDKFYQLGILYDFKKYGSNYKNVVLESETGYSNWIVKDSVSNADSNRGYKFLNINKIFSINANDKTLHESNDLLKTWKVIKTDVTSIFLRTETQWYIQSGDKLYVTTDSGQTWNLELDLPAGSIVNDISFSKSKIIVSGNKGLLYLKIE